MQRFNSHNNDNITQLCVTLTDIGATSTDVIVAPVIAISGSFSVLV